ncbi:MAG: hypothetical protein WGN25_20355 [Candidatus Electrothrix sp. GW3-4]|uniref:hypothetical protein n=1 Tax=Candidatus Electrothrix sp. GW3-4 TaxID=3126740 RepID=UPI0030CAE8C2
MQDEKIVICAYLKKRPFLSMYSPQNEHCFFGLLFTSCCHYGLRSAANARPTLTTWDKIKVFFKTPQALSN